MQPPRLFYGDCLELMMDIPDKSIDMVLCDLPYGTTACKWDSVIPMDELWSAYRRLLKPQGSVVLFGSEPFSTILRMSNLEAYKYDWIWRKSTATGFQHAKNMPLKDYENISVFSWGCMGHENLLGDKRMIYNPQGLMRYGKITKCSGSKFGHVCGKRPSHKDAVLREWSNYPRMVLEYAKDAENLHPTQKPVALCEYLIRTYTREGGMVLDNCMGSGSTGVAAIICEREFVGIEKNEEYFKIAKKRIEEAVEMPKQDELPF